MGISRKQNPDSVASDQVGHLQEVQDQQIQYLEKPRERKRERWIFKQYFKRLRKVHCEQLKGVPGAQYSQIPRHPNLEIVQTSNKESTQTKKKCLLLKCQKTKVEGR